MTTDRNPIDDEPLPGGLYDDEYPAADDDYGDLWDTPPAEQPWEHPYND